MKKIVSIAVSLGLLVVLYYFKIDVSELFKAFSRADIPFLILGVASTAPLILLIAWRLKQLMPSERELPFVEAVGLTLSAGSLNMLLPLKMGDIAKAVFLHESGRFSGTMSISLVTFEKALDILCLLLWCMLGLFMYSNISPLFLPVKCVVVPGFALGTVFLCSRGFSSFCFSHGKRLLPSRFHSKVDRISENWAEIVGYFFADRGKAARIIIYSILIWFMHLLQIWFFILAMGGSVPLLYNFALSPLVILAGIMPFTFAGMGTRDAALIVLFQPYLTAPVAAAVALLCTSRYILPAIAGLPFLDKYMRLARKKWFPNGGGVTVMK